MPGPGFRDLYGPAGPEGYYREHGDDYQNPHEAAVAAAVALAVARWRPPIDFARVLDLAAGGGEATVALARLVPDAAIDGIDPFTARLYERRTGRPCSAASFEQIAQGAYWLSEYSVILSSCALHLAGESWLPPLCLALAAAARDLLVITPLTRPAIREEWGWRLAGAAACEADGRSVRLRWYRSALLGEPPG
jgi:hypothetical protein